MITVGDAKNEHDVVRLIDQVEREVVRLRSAGAMSIQNAQRAENSLTRLQLVLNELERTEVQLRGTSREMAERFSALEGRIRTIRGELYEEPWQGGSAGAGGGRDEHHSAG
jgi:hypothetical protein